MRFSTVTPSMSIEKWTEVKGVALENGSSNPTFNLPAGSMFGLSVKLARAEKVVETLGALPDVFASRKTSARSVRLPPTGFNADVTAGLGARALVTSELCGAAVE